MSLKVEYEHALALLTGDAFQDEVSVRLATNILSFQNVPRKPNGDGGLDGLSHDSERAYCCYGPEFSSFRTRAGLTADIVEKFKSDLCRLFELTMNNRKVVPSENKEIAAILPEGTTLKHITLIVNWFDSNRIIGPIGTAVKKYRTSSCCKYVDKAATVIVWGPKDLATIFPVDESTILRSQHAKSLKEMQAAAQQMPISDPSKFDAKMSALGKLCAPFQADAIAGLKDTFLADWRMALAFDQKLDVTLPGLHKSLEDSRLRILQQVVQLMIASDKPWTQLGRAGDIARTTLAPDFEKTFGTALLGAISNGEVARLIGECSIGWEAPPNA
jgi:hypothetical protein